MPSPTQNRKPAAASDTSGGFSLDTLISNDVLDQAFTWLCGQRQDWPSHANVWAFRHHWPDEKARIQADLLTGTYQISLLSRTTLQSGRKSTSGRHAMPWS